MKGEGKIRNIYGWQECGLWFIVALFQAVPLEAWGMWNKNLLKKKKIINGSEIYQYCWKRTLKVNEQGPMVGLTYLVYLFELLVISKDFTFTLKLKFS